MIRAEWLNGRDDLSPVAAVWQCVNVNEKVTPASAGESNEAQYVLVRDGRRPVAAGCLINRDGRFTLDQIAVLSGERGQGYGDLVVRMLTRRAFELGGAEQYVTAPAELIHFFEKAGYHTEGPAFIHNNASYVAMIHQGDIQGACPV